MRSSKDVDAYGHEVWDYHMGRPAHEIIEREDGLLDSSETLPQGYFAPLKDWDPVEKKTIALARGKVLDVGCGAGRVALYLQKHRKLDVLGIDKSSLALKVARARGVSRTRLIVFKEMDFAPGSFDTIIMYGNNFGLFGSRNGVKRMLRKLHRMTSSDGLILCSSVNPCLTSNPDHLRYQRWNKSRGRMAGQIRMWARYLTWIGNWFDYLLVSPDEMTEIVKGTGWVVRRFINSGVGPLYVGVLKKRRAAS